MKRRKTQGGVLVALFFCGCLNPNMEDNRKTEEPIVVDSTYSKHWEESIVKDSIFHYEYLTLPAVNEYDQIIRFRGQDGWGVFDYICSIYCTAEKVTIQTISSEPSVFKEGRTYKIRERFLSQEAYHSVEQMLKEEGFQKIPFYLESSYSIDGNRFYIVQKKRNAIKTIVWQSNESIPSSKYHEKVKRIAYSLLDLGGYPSQEYVIYHEKIKGNKERCFIQLFNQILFDSLEVHYAKNVVKRPFESGIEIILPSDSLDIILDSLKVKVHTPLDTWIELSRKELSTNK